MNTPNHWPAEPAFLPPELWAVLLAVHPGGISPPGAAGVKPVAVIQEEESHKQVQDTDLDRGPLWVSEGRRQISGPS